MINVRIVDPPTFVAGAAYDATSCSLAHDILILAAVAPKEGCQNTWLATKVSIE